MLKVFFKIKSDRISVTKMYILKLNLYFPYFPKEYYGCLDVEMFHTTITYISICYNTKDINMEVFKFVPEDKHISCCDFSMFMAELQFPVQLHSCIYSLPYQINMK